MELCCTLLKGPRIRFVNQGFLEEFGQVLTKSRHNKFVKREQALRILAEHKDQWVAEYGLIKIGVFGSVARDEAEASSDVDVVVEMQHPDIFRLAYLRTDLIQVLGTDIDLIQDHDFLRPRFKAQLQKEAIYV